MTADLLKSIVPYPFAFGGELHDGVRLPQSRFCRHCVQKACLRRCCGDADFICPNGFSCYEVAFGDKFLVVNGVIGPEERSNFSGQRGMAYKQYRVAHDGIILVRSQLSAIVAYTSQAANEQVRDSVAFLHDIRTSVGIVLSWCQKLIAKQRGGSFEEKLGEVDGETANLFNSINLLQEQLELADIIANPASIAYGKKHRSGVNGFIFKMVKLFEPQAERRGVSIKLHGYTEAEMEAYNSFQFIPLILLDNAVKYSFTNRKIDVSLKEIGDLVSITVSSYGRLVPEDYRVRIFDKYIRGPRAVEQTLHGMGLGLFMARAIAQAHDTDITYCPHPSTGEVGNNSFSIAVRKAR